MSDNGKKAGDVSVNPDESLTVKLPEDEDTTDPVRAEALEKVMKTFLADRTKHRLVTKSFISKTQFSRGDLTRLRNVVLSYNALEDIDEQLALAQDE